MLLSFIVHPAFSTLRRPCPEFLVLGLHTRDCLINHYMSVSVNHRVVSGASEQNSRAGFSWWGAGAQFTWDH